MNYAHRTKKLKSSFVRDILSVANSADTISFAGGLPNPELFPTKEILYAAESVLTSSQAEKSLQYAESEGDIELRKYIAERYYKNSPFNHDNIIITNGSQQGLDLLGKLFIDPMTDILIESPCYLGALQALGVYEPNFIEIELQTDGLNIEQLKEKLSLYHPPFIYCVLIFKILRGYLIHWKNKSRLLKLLEIKILSLLRIILMLN